MSEVPEPQTGNGPRDSGFSGLNAIHAEVVTTNAIETDEVLSRIESVVGSAGWLDLMPSDPTDVDLLPKDLSAEHVGAVVSAVIDENVDGDEGVAIEGLGTLDKAGSGESSSVFVFTTEQGKKMAVKHMSALADTTYIPENGNLVPINKDIGGDVLRQYSTLQTYLMVPVSPDYAVVLQEYGGEQLGGKLRSWRSAIAGVRARRFLNQYGYEPDKNELVHHRHYLQKPGSRKVNVIDIPAIRKS